MSEQQLVNFLLVEDDDDHASLIKRTLKKSRVINQISWVEDGVAAMQFLRREGDYADAERPDIILLDLQLPKKSGLEVLKEIRQDPDLTVIPVVVLTTSGAESDRIKAYEYHANSYLTKPLDFDQFRQMVDDLSLYWGMWNKTPPPK